MKSLDTEYLIIGSGAGGATVAMELSKNNRRVIIAEKGYAVQRFGNICGADKVYDKHGLLKSKNNIDVYRGIATGGTTLISCGNAVRTMSEKFKEMGLDLDDGFNEAEKELSVSELPDWLIGNGTKKLVQAAMELNIKMKKMPKFILSDRCTGCGNCIFGCNNNARWTSVDYLQNAVTHGATILEGLDIKRILSQNGKAIGAEGANRFGEKVAISAKKIIVAAGGLGTPVILTNSGLKNVGTNLFLDLFNVTYGISDKIGLVGEPSMAVVCTDFYNKDGFILSPFLDMAIPFSMLLPIHKLRYILKRDRALGIMTKIADDNNGEVFSNGKFIKPVTADDFNKLKNGADIAKKILIKSGVKENNIFVTRIRGAHPGGTAAMGKVVDCNFESAIKNLYVCDASILPNAPGAPPILTIIALAKKLVKILLSA